MANTPVAGRLYATRLYDDPIIIYCKRWSLFDVESGAPDEPMHRIVHLLAGRDVVWLIPCPWLAEDAWAADIYLRTVAAVTRTAPRHRVVFVTNTHAEHRHLQRLKLASFVANQNQFVDRHLFFPARPVEDRRFCAVYNARFRDYKRHHLAAAVSRLAFIGYGFDTPEYAAIRDQMHSAHFANLRDGQPRFLTPSDVNDVLNQSACGLCLSRIEGAMTATVEYLLAGLPVVTTTNRGGRDLFLDGRFTRWVDAAPEEISREAESLEAEQIPPSFIRAETLRKLDSANEAFVTAVADVLSISSSSFGAALRRRFTHRLATPTLVSELIEGRVD